MDTKNQETQTVESKDPATQTIGMKLTGAAKESSTPPVETTNKEPSSTSVEATEESPSTSEEAVKESSSSSKKWVKTVPQKTGSKTNILGATGADNSGTEDDEVEEEPKQVDLDSDKRKVQNAAEDMANRIVSSNPEKATGEGMFVQVNEQLGLTNKDIKTVETLKNKNDKQGLKQFFANLLSKLPAASVKSIMEKIPTSEDIRGMASGIGTKVSNTAKGVKDKAKRAIKGEDKMLAEQKEKLINMYKDYINFTKAHNSLLVELKGMGDKRFKKFTGEFCGKHEDINSKLWISATDNKMDDGALIDGIEKCETLIALGSHIKNLYVELSLWFSDENDTSLSTDEMWRSAEKKLNKITEELWRDFSRTAEGYISDSKAVKGLFREETETGDDFNLTSLQEKIKEKIDGLIGNLNPSTDEKGLLDSLAEKSFINYEKQYMVRIINKLSGNRSAYFGSELQKIEDEFKNLKGDEAQAQYIIQMCKLIEEAFKVLQDEQETYSSVDKVTQTISDLKGKTEGLLNEYEKIYEGNSDLWDGLKECVFSGNLRQSLDSAKDVKALETVLQDLILKGVLAPLSSSKEKFEQRCKNVQCKYEEGDISAATNKAKIDSMTQMYGLAERAVNHLKNVVKKQEKLQKKTGTLGKKIAYKFKKLGRAVGKKADKAVDFVAEKLPGGEKGKKHHLFHDSKESKLKKKYGGDKVKLNKKLEELGAKKLGKCFKAVAQYIVEDDSVSFKRATALSSFKPVSSVEGLKDWYERLAGMLNGTVTLSPISLKGDNEKEYKKATVAVLLASICGLPSSLYVIAACDGLKNGGLKGKFKNRKYLMNAIEIHKILKNAAVQHPNDDGSEIENNLANRKDEFKTLIGNYNTFKSNVIDKFIEPRKTAAAAAKAAKEAAEAKAAAEANADSSSNDATSPVTGSAPPSSE